MANMAYTRLVIEGKKENVEKIHEEFIKLVDISSSDATSEFGDMDACCLLNVVARAWNIEPATYKYLDLQNKLRCYFNIPPREEKEDFMRDIHVNSFVEAVEDEISAIDNGNYYFAVRTWDKWNATYALYKIIQDIFEVTIYFITEETGMCIFVTNDADQKYFKERIFIQVEESERTDELRLDTEYYAETLEEIFSYYQVKSKEELVEKYTVNCCEEYGIMSIDEFINN